MVNKNSKEINEKEEIRKIHSKLLNNGFGDGKLIN